MFERKASEQKVDVVVGGRQLRGSPLGIITERKMKFQTKC